jgi:hypothetical protein
MARLCLLLVFVSSARDRRDSGRQLNAGRKTNRAEVQQDIFDWLESARAMRGTWLFFD